MSRASAKRLRGLLDQGPRRQPGDLPQGAPADAQHISDWLARNIPRDERPAQKPMAA